MSKMKAAIITEYGNTDVIKISDIPKPHPKDDEILIKISYAGINPVDIKICGGFLKERMPNIFPITLGWDASGTVEEVGKSVSSYAKGDNVLAYCRKDNIHDGTFAEYICVKEIHLTKINSLASLSLKDAASLPLVSLTAWQSLCGLANIKRGQKILIHGGSGGVGSMAIQIAKYKGARVYTTTSMNEEYVKKLGADVAINYKKGDVYKTMRRFEEDGIDIVYDTIGGDDYANSCMLLKKGGVIVSILAQSERIRKSMENMYQINTKYLFVEPNHKQLAEIVTLIENGTLKVPKITEYNLNDVKEALEKQKSGHVVGKIVLKCI